MSIISLKNISYSYGDQSALQDIDLEIKAGEFWGVIGPNGSGKTTLLRIMLGLLAPTTGSVKLFGQPLKNFNQWSKVGYVPQRLGGDRVHFPLTVRELVSLGRVSHQRRWDFFSAADSQAVTDALQAVEMLAHQHALISQLSGGQQQRVYIARALVSQPEVLILDEPTVGVDTQSQHAFYELLRHLNTARHLTLVLVSHDVEVIAQEVSRLACLNRTLVGQGKPKDVLASAAMTKAYGKEMRLVVHQH